MPENTLKKSQVNVNMELKEVRCSCGKLLGKVQEGAAHEIKCSRCKRIIEQAGFTKLDVIAINQCKISIA